jgi:hypothetical protein
MVRFLYTVGNNPDKPQGKFLLCWNLNLPEDVQREQTSFEFFSVILNDDDCFRNNDPFNNNNNNSVQTDINRCKIGNWEKKSLNRTEWEKSIKEVKFRTVL